MYNTDLPGRAELPSTARLLRSTLIAAVVAASLLVTAVLPAENGIDPTGIGRVLGLTPMGEIKGSLVAEGRTEELRARDAVAAPSPAASPAAPEAIALRQDTMTVKLKPGQGAEIKLVMNKNGQVKYEWTVAGGAVNFDTHGDPHNAPKNFYHGYGKGRNQTSDAGELQAALDGKHGWFWRNRSGGVVTITLKTNGDYEKIERVI